ncbi:TolC family protein [uncultured Bacteroides sp.]|uniref:TolC family protein n=1 Tax=uncultured Bacteroides sp. TaxID=162156 RepID=UPI0025FF43DF|nr:TolC family protein [uncultured Bacteroides sp.]
MMKTIIFILSFMAFGISALAQEAHLSREAYRDRVEAYSQILKQQRLKVTASTETRKIVQTGFLPKIDITAEGTSNLSRLDAWNSPAGQYRPYTYQALATLGQPLYTGGSLIAQKNIAKADEELDKLAVELTLDRIHYQSDAVYWNASAALAMLEAAARFEDIINRQYNIIQDRFDDGAISRTDLLMISTRKKEAELQYIKARQNYTLALQQLNILIGEKPDAPVDSLSEIHTSHQPVRLLSIDEVLGRRADYNSTNVSIAKSEAQRKAALSQYNPQLSMFLATGWDTGTAYMGQDVPHTPIAGINLSIPIFRWGARFKTNRQQKAYIGIQKLQQSYVADAILEELSAAATKLTETEQQVKKAQENMALAEENLDLVTFSYNEGRASMVDVLSAQLSWTQAQTNLIHAHLAAKMAVAEYRKVISE